MADLHLQRLTEANRIFADQIKTADQKAAYVFTFLLAVLVWSSETRRAFNRSHLAETPAPTALVRLALALSIVTALVSAVLAPPPRSRPAGAALRRRRLCGPARAARLAQARLAQARLAQARSTQGRSTQGRSTLPGRSRGS